MHRQLAAMAIMVLGVDGAAAQGLAAAAPQSLTFAASRNGQPIGTHTVRIVDQGDRRTVVNSIDLALKALGVTVYRYAHHSTEVWQGDRLQSLSARTEDNGATHKVQVNRQGESLRVDREERKSVIKAVSFEQVMPAETRSASETQPGTLLPTSLWYRRIATQSALLNAQSGKPSRIQVSKLGRDTVRTSRLSIEATRYRYAGDLRID